MFSQKEEHAIAFQKEAGKCSVLHYPPLWATIGIINACINKCIFCAYHAKDAKKNSKVYNVPFKMSFERFKKNVDFFKAGGVPHIHICATGEPFLHPDIMEMIDYVIDVYGKVSFQSNLNKNIMDRHNYIDKILERKQYISYITSDTFCNDKYFFESVKVGSSYEDQIKTLKIFSDANIPLLANAIITKLSYKYLLGIIEAFVKHKINAKLSLSNIFPHGFNAYTSIENVFRSTDDEIKKYIENCKKLASRFGYQVVGGQPFDSPDNFCSVFWEKIQVWPVSGIDKHRYCENLIPHGCNAVVLGDLNSLGYIDDFSSVMEWWNSPKLIGIREMILAGKAPDKHCNLCPYGCRLS